MPFPGAGKGRGCAARISPDTRENLFEAACIPLFTQLHRSSSIDMADNVVSSHVGLRSGEPADAKPSSTSLPPSGSLTPSEDEKALDDPLYKSGQSSLYDIQSVAPLAPRQDKPPTPGHALLVWLRLRKPDQRPDWDAVSMTGRRP